MFGEFPFLAPLCHVRFSNADSSIVGIVGVKFTGRRANLRNSSVIFLFFWPEASLG